MLQGCFLWGADLVGSASSGVTADDVGRLAWLVVTDGSPNLTATFWERVEDPSQQQTTVFQLPSVLGFEKAGIRASGGRLLHAAAAVEPAAESRTDAAIGDVWSAFNLYDTKGGAATDPILGPGNYVTSDSKICEGGPGDEGVVEDSDWTAELAFLKVPTDCAPMVDDCGAAFWRAVVERRQADAAEQPVGRRDGADESGLGLFPRLLRGPATRVCATGRARIWRASPGARAHPWLGGESCASTRPTSDSARRTMARADNQAFPVLGSRWGFWCPTGWATGLCPSTTNRWSPR
ncbi:MAG: hypothetical protein ACLUW6_02800 [Coriobacteriaceae bacterium]